MSAYSELHQHFARIGDLSHAAAIVSWDEAAMMPKGGGKARGRAMATLGVTVHGMTADPKVADWLDAASAQNDLSDWQRANIREMRRVFELATCISPDLVEARSLATARCEQAWRQCRSENDWATMAPMLDEVIRIAREEAAARSAATGLGLYDAMLDTYEPGMRASRVEVLFDELKAFLPRFAREVIERQALNPPTPLLGPFPVDKQRDLGIAMMQALGFDFDHGRLDISHHPFCGGVPDDVRITTRYDEATFASSLMAVLHETGHAMYEQGLPAEWRGQPVGEALSMATHESHSLLMELPACRTAEFVSYMAPIAQRTFLGHEVDDLAWSSRNLLALCTRVEMGHIRVDADEVTYPLHVILRFEIERDLVEGRLEVRDLPEAWDEKMMAYLSLDTRGNYTDGCLQDVHWPAGLVGYFPTYSLGAMTAAQLFAAAGKALGDVLADIGRGDFSRLLGWLRDHVHGQGSKLGYDELLQRATGSELDAGYFRKHLEARYGS